MRNEGYAAVSSRRVAKEADVKASLVHYYFPTTDDLFLALFQRAADEEVIKQDEALSTPDALETLWGSYCNRDRTVLAMEFMALANHRPAIRQEINQYTERTRKSRAELLGTLIQSKATESNSCSAAGLSVLLVAVARTLITEKELGISFGHDEAKIFIDQLLSQLEG